MTELKLKRANEIKIELFTLESIQFAVNRNQIMLSEYSEYGSKSLRADKVKELVPDLEDRIKLKRQALLKEFEEL